MNLLKSFIYNTNRNHDIIEKTIKEYNNKKYKILDNFAKDSYSEDNLDNTFTVFESINNLLNLIYSTENKSIISYNLIENKKLIEFKKAHKDYITNIRHYLDKIQKRDLIISTSGHDNNLKLWNFQNWDCICNI